MAPRPTLSPGCTLSSCTTPSTSEPRRAVRRSSKTTRPAASRGSTRSTVVAVGLFADDVARGLAFLTWLLGGVWLVSVAGTAALGYLLASRALAPVARITERAAWIAQGHFDGRLDEPQIHDEVGRMTVLLNSMLDRLQRALDAIRDAPAAVGNGLGDLLAANHLGRALYSDLYADPTGKPNFARFTFLDSAARRFYPDWDYYADITVAMLRTQAGRDPHDRQLHELVGELSTRSDEFRRRWSAHDVRIHTTGTKHFHHPVVGDLTLAYQTVDLRLEASVALTIYAAEPASRSADALRLLASWSAAASRAKDDDPVLQSRVLEPAKVSARGRSEAERRALAQDLRRTAQDISPGTAAIAGSDA